MKELIELLFEKIEWKLSDVVYYDNTFDYYKWDFEQMGEVTISGINYGGNDEDSVMHWLTDKFKEIKEELKNENELTKEEIEFIDSLLFEDVSVNELEFLCKTYEFTFRIHTNTDD